MTELGHGCVAAAEPRLYIGSYLLRGQYYNLAEHIIDFHTTVISCFILLSSVLKIHVPKSARKTSAFLDTQYSYDVLESDTSATDPLLGAQLVKG